MTQTRINNIFRTRDILDTPILNAPSFHQLLRQTLSEEIDVVNDLNNSATPWCTNTYQFNYFPNNNQPIAINATDFGKVLFVVRLTNNPWVPALPVPFADLNELNYGTIWNTFYNLYSGWGAYTLSETIEQMAFYRSGTSNQEVKVQVQPQPLESATYIITYLSTPNFNDDPLNSTPALNEFSTMTQLRAALALLPYSRWDDADEASNMAKRKEMAASFVYQLGRKEKQYAEYRENMVQPRITEIAGFGDDYY